MATRSSRDVPLTLSVSTLGTEAIDALEMQVKQLAREGGAAAPAFQALSDQIARLGDQADLVNTARSLSEEIAQLAEAQGLAQVRAKELGDELDRLQANTTALATVERQAKDEVQTAQRALFDKRQELARYKNETSSSEKETSRYTAEVRRMKAEIIAGKTELRDKTDAYRAARAATRDATAEESRFERTVSQVTAQVQAGQRTLAQRNQELERAQQALRESSLATDDVVTAEARLIDAYNDSADAIANLRAEQDRLAESEAALAFEAQAAAAAYVNFWQEALRQRDEDVRAAEQRRAAEQEEANRRIIESQRAADREEERLAIIQLNRRRELEAAAQAEADGIVRDYQRMEQAARETAQATEQATRQMDDAFRTVGTQSVQALEQEIRDVRNAMELLRSSGTLTGRELDQAFAASERRIRELERQIRAATGQTTLLDRASQGLRSTFGQFAAAFGVVEVVQRLGGAFVRANTEIERLRLGLGSVLGNAKLAEQQIGFLRQSANSAGVSIGEITDSFIKFTASTTAANIPLEQTNALFQAVTQASGRLGLSGERVRLVLDALSQMSAKTVVSMEELRQQLGDSLPGALSLTARGLGITERELIKLVESGGLLARDLFPALTRSLQSLSGEVNTLTAYWQRFKNALTETAQTAGDSGWIDVMKGALVGLGTVILPIGVGLNTIFETIFTRARQLGAFLAALVNRDFSILGDELKRLEDESLARQVKVIETLKNVSIFADRSAASQANLAQQTQQSATATARSATALGQAASSAQQLATSGAAAAQSTQAVGQAAESAVAPVNLLGQSWQRLNIDYTAAVSTSAQLIVNAEKLARAKEIEGQASVTLAELTGSETRVLEANAFATLNQARAVGEVVSRREQELQTMAAYRDALAAEAERLGDPDGSRQQQIESINETILAREAELERSRQQQAELLAESEARTLAVQVYKDNAAAVDELRLAMELAQSTAQQTIALERQGFASKEQVERATLAAARAEALYRDALEDSEAALQRSTRAIRDRANVTQASTNLDIARSRASETLARAMGNETLVLIEQINQKRIEIAQVRAASDAKRVEAEAIIANTQAQIENLRALGELTPEKEAELQSRLANAQAMQLEAAAGIENIRILEAEIDALRRNSDERLRNQGIRQGGGSGGGGGTGGGAQGAAAGADRFGRPSVTSREDRLAGQNAVDNSLIFDLLARMRAGRLTADDIGSLQAAMAALDQNEAVNRDLDRLNPGAFSLEGAADRNRWRNIRQQFGQEVSRLSGGGRVSRVEVKIGQRTSTINTASQADSDALVRTLQQIENASMRAV